MVVQPFLCPFVTDISLITVANVSSFHLNNKRFYDFVFVISLFG